MLKKLLVALISAIVTLAVLAVGYEIVQAHRYERWRSDFKDTGDWYGGLTVASSDPILMWEYRPNWEHVHPDYHTVTRTNEFGFRQKSGVDLSSPDGVHRIAFIGDSVTLGREIQFEQMFSQVTEAILNNRPDDARYEALNFGIDGYNTPQIKRLLTTKVFRYSPDVVIYALCLNDFDFEEASGSKIRFFRKPESFLLEDLVRTTRRLFANDYHRYYYNRNKDRVFEEIVAMEAATKRRGVKFLTIVLPGFMAEHFSRLENWRKSQLDNFEQYPLGHIHDEIVHELRARGVHSVDILPRFLESGLSPEAVAYDVWHMKAEGHDLVGKAIAQLLMQSDLASRPVSP